MKLSEAIRLGSMTGPQHFGGYYGDDDASCALGAAAKALGICTLLIGDIGDQFDVHDCPECGSTFEQRRAEYLKFKSDISPALIPHLNDDHSWTREAIADWVQTIEDAHPALRSAEEAVLG